MKITSHPARRVAAAYTLLEMIIVMMIITIISGSAIYLMKNVTNTASVKRARADFQTIQTALQTYKLNTLSYPTTAQGLMALVNKPSPSPRSWQKVMDAVPMDPWNNQYMYRFPGKKNPSEPEILSKGPDGQENTEDDLSSQDS